MWNLYHVALNREFSIPMFFYLCFFGTIICENSNDNPGVYLQHNFRKEGFIYMANTRMTFQCEHQVNFKDEAVTSWYWMVNETKYTKTSNPSNLLQKDPVPRIIVLKEETKNNKTTTVLAINPILCKDHGAHVMCQLRTLPPHEALLGVHAGRTLFVQLGSLQTKEPNIEVQGYLPCGQLDYICRDNCDGLIPVDMRLNFTCTYPVILPVKSDYKDLASRLEFTVRQGGRVVTTFTAEPDVIRKAKTRVCNEALNIKQNFVYNANQQLLNESRVLEFSCVIRSPRGSDRSIWKPYCFIEPPKPATIKTTNRLVYTTSRTGRSTKIGSSNLLYYLLAIGVLLIVIITVVLVVLWRRKRRYYIDQDLKSTRSENQDSRDVSVATYDEDDLEEQNGLGNGGDSRPDLTISGKSSKRRSHQSGMKHTGKGSQGILDVVQSHDQELNTLLDNRGLVSGTEQHAMKGKHAGLKKNGKGSNIVKPGGDRRGLSTAKERTAGMNAENARLLPENASSPFKEYIPVKKLVPQLEHRNRRNQALGIEGTSRIEVLPIATGKCQEAFEALPDKTGIDTVRHITQKSFIILPNELSDTPSTVIQLKTNSEVWNAKNTNTLQIPRF